MRYTKRREQWMTDFQRAVVALDPAFAGKINWDAASFQFTSGRTPQDAATLFVENEKPVDRRF
jgi:hypothetical protein